MKEKLIRISKGLPDEGGDDVPDPLVDLTQPLAIHSKRTERRRKKLEKKVKSAPVLQARELLDLPYELLISILVWLQPRDVFVLCRVNRGLRSFILSQEDHIGNCIIRLRYPILSKSLPPPIFLEKVDVSAHEALLNPGRSELESMLKKPFQHIQPPDITLVCSCLACIQRWNSLCIAVDFAHWQGHLDKGEPIPMIPRGTHPAWNRDLTSKNAAIVIRSMTSRLWYARILEAHLDSMTRSIRRHGQNKGNRRRRFRMMDEDVRTGTDAFLERSGPPTVDLPFHRDNYYMLEAFLPNRSWIADRNAWVYVPAEQHDNDVKMIVRWHPYRS